MQRGRPARRPIGGAHERASLLSRSLPHLVLFFALAGGGVLLGCVFTYSGRLDGPLAPYLLGLAVAGGGALIAGGAALAGLVPAWLSLALALAVLLPAPSVHLARFANRHMAVDQQLGRLVEYGRVLEPVLQGQASLRPEGDALALRVPAGSIGYLEVRRPDDHLNRWNVPRALSAPVALGGQESLVWTAEVTPTGYFFVLVDTGHLLVQLYLLGDQTLLLATYGPALAGSVGGSTPPGGTRAGLQTVPAPVISGFRNWTLTRGGGRITLGVDGRDALALPDVGAFRFLRLGETRTDGEHGGTLRLRALRYTRSLA